MKTLPKSRKTRKGSSLRRMVRRWRKTRPANDGWWLWREGGRSRVDKLLLSGGGRCVNSDVEWEQATGRPPEKDAWWTENYWEGTDTTQKMMPGLWMKAPNAPDQRPAKQDDEKH